MNFYTDRHWVENINKFKTIAIETLPAKAERERKLKINEQRLSGL